MSPTQNGHSHRGGGGGDSASSSTGTIPKRSKKPSASPSAAATIQAANSLPSATPPFNHSPAPSSATPLAPSSSSEDAQLDQQNLVLSRLREQENQRALRAQRQLLQWQSDPWAQQRGFREDQIQEVLNSVQQQLQQQQQQAGFEERTQVMGNNLSDLQQRLSILRLLDDEANNSQQQQQLEQQQHQQPPLTNGPSSFQQTQQVADMESLISEKMELIDKLRLMESKKNRLDNMIRQFSMLQQDRAEPAVTSHRTEPSQQAVNQMPKQGEDVKDLKSKLRELQQMVSSLERPMQQPEPNRFRYQNEPVVNGCPEPAPRQLQATDNLLVEMQEQLKLQKDLHLRRKELEELMRKDILDSLQKNEDRSRQNLSDSKSDISSRSTTGWFQDSQSLSTLDLRNHPVPANHDHRRLSMSSNRSNDNKMNLQLKSLQAQIESLHMEVRRLSTPAASAAAVGPQMSQSLNPNDFSSMPAYSEPPSNHFFLAQQQQQGQIQQLTNSLNQCYQAVVGLQRDVAGLQRSVEKLTRQQSRQGESNLPQGPSLNESRSPNAAAQPPELGNLDGGGRLNGSQQSREFDPWHISDVDFASASLVGALEASHSQWNHLTQDPWGLQSNGLNPETTSAGGMALNNQVPPGVRANNYWDNFRSFSRQNRLSNNNHPPPPPPPPLTMPVTSTPATSANNNALPGSAPAPNVAQVTPRQLQAASVDPRPTIRQAFVEPHFSSLNSPPRPRRKQKINREQNREMLPQPNNSERNHRGSSSSTSAPLESATQGLNAATAAAMVFPMPQNQDNRNVNSEQAVSSTNTSFPINQVNPVVSSLTRSIYHQINDLITQHEESPDELAKIYRDLQSLDNRLVPDSTSREQRGNGNNGHLLGAASGNVRAEADSGPVPVLPLLGRSGAVPRTNDSNSYATNNARKTEAKARQPRRGASNSLRNEESSLFSIHNSLGKMSSLLQTAGAVGGSNGEDADAEDDFNDLVENEVPKNVQKNLNEKPRNMQETSSSEEAKSMPEEDANNLDQDFINVQLQFHPRHVHHHHPGSNNDAEALQPLANRSASNAAAEDEPQNNNAAAVANNNEEEEEESEMAEADQDHSPEHSVLQPAAAAAAEPDQAVEGAVGGEGVEASPGCLAADYEQLRREEEESMQNIVEEVLAAGTESELAEDKDASVPKPPKNN